MEEILGFGRLCDCLVPSVHSLNGITPVPYNEIGESICELKIEAQDG